jgi:hypothetical protein
VNVTSGIEDDQAESDIEKIIVPVKNQDYFFA